MYQSQLLTAAPAIWITSPASGTAWDALPRLAMDVFAERAMWEDFFVAVFLERFRFERSPWPEIGIDLDGKSEATCQWM